MKQVMLLSEYIEELRRALEVHGDHEVTDSEDQPIGEPEFDDGGFGARPSHVLAERA